MMSLNELFETLALAKEDLFDGYPFEAIGRLFGERTESFLQIKIYRKILILAWRIRVRWYLCARRITTYKQNTTNYFANIVKDVILKSGSDRQLKQIRGKVPQKHTMVAGSYTGIFPMEIWLDIAMLTPSITGNLMRFNKTFCDTFAPILYEELNLHFSISSTTKMRLNDANFLKYGPDFLEDWKTVDLDHVYKRHQQSEKCDFEFLDLYKETFYGLDDGKEMYGDLISNNYVISCLFKEVIGNPKSFLKKYIKDLSLTVQVIQGAHELLLKKDNSKNSVIEYLEDHVSRNKDVFFVPYEGCPYFAAPIQDRFQQDRWTGPGSVLREFLQRKEHRDYFFTGEEFPKRVYGKELLGAAIVLNFLQTGDNRKKLREVETNEEFGELDPFYHYDLQVQKQYGEQPSEENEYEAFLNFITDATQGIGLIEVKEVEIAKRKLTTASFARAVVKKMIQVMTSNNATSTMNTSFMLVSQANRDVIEVNYPDVGADGFNTDIMVYHAPYTFLINKPKNAEIVEKRARRRKRLAKKHMKQGKREKRKKH